MNLFWHFRFVPTKADVSVLGAIKDVGSAYPHVQRWQRHISSFSDAERNVWAGQLLPQLAGAQPTVQKPTAAKPDDGITKI